MNTLDFTPVPSRLIFSKLQTWLILFSVKTGTVLDLRNCSINAFISQNDVLVKRLKEGAGIVTSTDGRSFELKNDLISINQNDTTPNFDLIATGTFTLDVVLTDSNGIDHSIANFIVEVKSNPIDSTERVTTINAFEFDLKSLEYSMSLPLNRTVTEEKTTFLSIVENNKYKAAFVDDLMRVYFGIDKDDNIDAKGLSERLSQFASNFTKNDIGFSVLENNKYKAAFVDDLMRVYFGIDKDDNIDAKGLSERLSQFASNFTKNDIGFSVLENNKYKAAFVDDLMRVYFGIDKDDNIDAKGLSERLSQFASNFTKNDIGFSVLENNKFVWALVNNATNQVCFGLTHELKFVCDLANQVSVASTEVQKTLIAKGDSLTAGAGGNGVTYTTVLGSLMPPNWRIVNTGVGGESVGPICARDGGMPAFFTEGFSLPADTTPVEVSSASNVRLKNALNAEIKPLLQGDGNSVNPCFVEGIECTLNWTGTSWNDPQGKYMLNRNHNANTPTVISQKTPIVFFGAKAYRDAEIIVIFMGQNGGYSSTEEYIKYVDSILKYNRKSNFIIVTPHTGTPAERAELENRCFAEYGLRYVNLRKYMSEKALYDLVITPTSADLTAMANGTFPPSLWSSAGDSVHGNANFYIALGRYLYQLIVTLNYL